VAVYAALGIVFTLLPATFIPPSREPPPDGFIRLAYVSAATVLNLAVYGRMVLPVGPAAGGKKL